MLLGSLLLFRTQVFRTDGCPTLLVQPFSPQSSLQAFEIHQKMDNCQFLNLLLLKIPPMIELKLLKMFSILKLPSIV